MQLTIDELIRYTSEERTKWERWFAVHGDAPLAFRLAGETHATVGALIRHIFRPEQRYAQRLRDKPLTEDQNVPTDTWVELFAFGRQSREELRRFVEAAKTEDWGRIHEFDVQQYHIRATTRKIILHVLIHEIRHWAQIARVVRENGMAPPGEHDLLLSSALE
jgi:uncharacterized damage-inducible protein DinB